MRDGLNPSSVPGAGLVALAFVVIAAGLIAWAAVAVYRASLACGDSRGAARRRSIRVLAWAAVWVSLALTLSAAGVFRRWDLTPPPFLGLAASILIVGVVFARSEAGDRLARGLPLAELVAEAI